MIAAIRDKLETLEEGDTLEINGMTFTANGPSKGKSKSVAAKSDAEGPSEEFIQSIKDDLRNLKPGESIVRDGWVI